VEVSQFLIVHNVVRNRHEKRVDAPNCRDDADVDLGELCKVHANDGQVLDGEIDQAVADEAEEFAPLQLAPDDDVLIVPDLAVLSQVLDRLLHVINQTRDDTPTCKVEDAGGPHFGGDLRKGGIAESKAETSGEGEPEPL